MNVDCMACLVAMSQGWKSDGMFQDTGGITHATGWHVSYEEWRIVVCSITPDGRAWLVRK